MATVAFFYEVLALLAAASLFVVFLRGTQGVPEPAAARTRRQGPVTPLSVVVVVDPVVDVEHCVASLLAQEYPKLEIFFVVQQGARLDESSAARIEADPRATAVRMDKPPAGWTRRNEAFAAGFRRTSSDYVLLMDGNVLLRPQALERSLVLARQRGTDLLTIFPALTATSKVERLLIPFFLQLTLAGVSLRKINDPGSDMAGGFAPFFLFRRTAYEALGGHAAVRADRYADSTLAQRVKDKGYRLLVANGTELAVLQGQNRLRDIWASWSQSFYEAVGDDTRQAALVALLVVGVFAVPWLLVVYALVDLITAPGPAATSPWLGVLLIGSANVMLGMLHRRMLRNLLDLDDSLAWLQPLAAMITAAMIFASSLRLEGTWLARFTGRVVAPQ